MPVVRQSFPEQHQVTVRKRTDVITHKLRSLATEEQGQLHLRMEMPAVSRTCDADGAIRCDNRFHLIKASIPFDQAERVSARWKDFLTNATHWDDDGTIFGIGKDGVRQSSQGWRSES
ncbi:hypothetical protein llg_20500 [Luteolibacter sp. LG18]|nr:hypothetical protein llg_20500 [Luteolibacter sp. LG18]